MEIITFFYGNVLTCTKKIVKYGVTFVATLNDCKIFSKDSI